MSANIIHSARNFSAARFVSGQSTGSVPSFPSAGKPQMIDYYELLRVAPTVSTEEIRKAFRRLRKTIPSEFAAT